MPDTGRMRGTDRCYGAGGEAWQLRRCILSMECRDAPAKRPRLSQGQALSRSLVALDQNRTIIAVVELSHSSWLVAGMLPGIERQPRKKLEPSPEHLLTLLHGWRDEAVRAGRTITRIALAFEAGREPRASPDQTSPRRRCPTMVHRRSLVADKPSIRAGSSRTHRTSTARRVKRSPAG